MNVKVGIICEGVSRTERDVETIRNGLAFVHMTEVLKTNGMVPRKFTVRACNAWAAGGYATMIGHPVTVLPSSHAKFADIEKFVESNDVLVLDLGSPVWKSEEISYMFEHLLTKPRAVFAVSKDFECCRPMSAHKIREYGTDAVDHRRPHGTSAFYKLARTELSKKRPAPEPVDPAAEVHEPTVAPPAPRKIRKPILLSSLLPK